jgi:hypothetical protein
LLALVPVVSLPAFILALVFRPTQYAAAWLMRENHPIELGTFVLLLLAAGGALRLARRTRRHGAPALVWGFYGVFAAGMFLAAMEEVAWGQWLFRFPTPEVVKTLNVQGELTLHNLRGVSGKTEFARLAFGLGGLAGIVLAQVEGLHAIAAPAYLWPWFVMVAVHAGLDAYADLVTLSPWFEALLNPSSELVELLIGVSAYLYVRAHRGDAA